MSLSGTPPHFPKGTTTTMRLHLRFKNIRPGAIAAADALFAATPWRDEDPEIHRNAAQAFVDRICEVYGVRPAVVRIEPDLPRSFFAYSPAVVIEGPDSEQVEVEPTTIALGEFSILTLFFGTRIHLVANDEALESRTRSQDDVQAWGCSLFYAVKPVMFRARAREGRVYGVTAKDTFTTATWQSLIADGLATEEFLLVEHNDPRLTRDALADEDETVDEADLVDDTDLSEATGIVLSGTDGGEDEEDGLDRLNRDAIRALAREHNIPGRGRLNRDELVAALRNAGVSV